VSEKSSCKLSPEEAAKNLSLTAAKGDALNISERLFFHKSKSPKSILQNFFSCLALKKVYVPVDPCITEEGFRQLSRYFPASQLPLEATLGIFTSGTTGEPKLIVHSWQNIISSYLASKDFYRFQEPLVSPISLPMHHIGGFMQILRSHLSGGRTITGTSPKTAHMDIQNPDINIISLVPTQLISLLHTHPKEKKWPKIKLILIGGAHCPNHLAQEAITRNLPISLTYGSTETCAMAAGTHPGTLGPLKPLKGRIFAESSGQITLKGGMLLGKLSTDGQFEEHKDKNYYITSDQGSFDKKGDSLKVTGRNDSTIICGGENIDPKEILQSLSDQENTYIVSLPSERLGSIPALVRISTDENCLEEVYVEIKNKLPRAKQPRRYFHLTPETLSTKLTPQSLINLIKKNPGGFTELQQP